MPKIIKSNNQRKLLQLLADNRVNQDAKHAKRPKAEIVGQVAHIYLEDVIDPYWGYSCAYLREDLAAANGLPVDLHINTPGGDVFEALAMAAVISGYSNTVTARIAGLCASSGTRVAIACASASMTEGSLYMVHNAWTLSVGNAQDMRATADLLDKVDAGIAADYARKTGQTAAVCAAWMAAETWFTAQEAKDAALIDVIDQPANSGSSSDGGAASAQAKAARWNLSAYTHAPKLQQQASSGLRAELSDKLNARQAELYSAFEVIAEEFGAFDQGIGATGAHYMPASPFADRGIKCANCALYMGSRACEVVGGDIDPAGACKLWIIPEQLIQHPEPTPPDSNLAALAQAHQRLARARLGALASRS